MHRIPVYVPGLVLLLIACLLIAGCSSPETTNQTAQPGTTTTAVTAGVQYSAGDIVRNPKSGSDITWLVLAYDAASDKYERALIYKNADSSWGYRSDNRTEKADRSVMDKVYTEIVENIPPSSVPIVTPKIITPVETFQLPANWTGISTGTTTNTSEQQKPGILRSIPDKGKTGTTVVITDLVGSGFLAGASVTLSHSGHAAITAKNVKVVSQKSITCTFDIPADAPAGTWDLTVKNTNGLSGTYTNYFTINREFGVVTTTYSPYSGTVPLTSIDPPTAFSNQYQEYIITGSKFQTGAKVILRSQSGKANIEGTEIRVESDTRIRCFFQFPQGSFGNWDLIVTNPDSTYGAWIGALYVQ
jgi:hypothetical protein